ncbi:hypothetical protein CCR85_06435 [Rhodothalassium salexigens]|nr:hypothetical protein [Rhodothalassium salexigens]MBK5921983.1 hypothetical protein [Rhodothalassium salexigens]
MVLGPWPVPVGGVHRLWAGIGGTAAGCLALLLAAGGVFVARFLAWFLAVFGAQRKNFIACVD